MSTRSRALTAVITAVVLACPAVALSSSSAAPSPGPAAAASEVPTGFQDTVAIDGLSEPTAVAFAPDGTAFIGLKTGVIKSFDYNQANSTYEPWATHVNVTNLDVQVNNYWDRGLTGIAVDPQFGTAGNNYVYVNYAYNRDPRVTPESYPAWGTPGQQYDDCANPAAMGPPAVSGCVINIRVSRIPVAKQASGWIASGPEEELLEGACMQFPSHASGDVAFGPDGYLYASAGDGASFDTEDYGQAGNPCGDPANEGGSLRSQDIRTNGDPLSVSGSIFRINKATGAAPNGSSNNADRIVAYGQRNPWRLTFRPGTSELWSGDVGGSIWEEINRVDMGSFTAPVNRGWPCYEGSYTGLQRQPGWDALNRDICETLYAAEAATPGTVTAPYFSYRTRNGGPMTPGENCVEGTSSVSGVAFIPSTSTYPAQYRGSLFFNDYARGCIWRLGKLGNGDPDPNSITPFVEAADTPVAIEVGPGGDLFYVDYGIVNGVPTGGAGGIHRIVYTPGNQAPVAAVTANPTSGAAPLTVNFSAAGSTDGDGDALTFEWALDGDGVFDDGGGATKSRTYSAPGSVTVQVRVSDGRGGTDTAEVVVSPGNSPPTITAMSPAASLTWSVGETVDFSATATDSQQSLANSAYSWSLSIQHCPSVCHTHPIQTWVGQRTGSFQAPDHEYPSNLLLQVTVTDNQGLTDVETRQLDPKSVPMTFASNPTGAALTVAGTGVFAPHNQTFIQGSGFNVSAPPTRQFGGANYSFTSWSDGGAATHAVVAPTTATTLTANYTRQNRLPTVTVSANPTSGTAPLTVDFSTNATDPDGDNAGFTYVWALDGDGVFDDGGGATKQKQYTTAGSRAVQVRVTDSHGGQDTDQVTVNVATANQSPVAAIATTPASPSGPAPFNVTFSASGSSDPDSDPLTYAWDLDNDAAFDDATGVSASRSYAVGSHVVRVQVSDGRGGTDVEQVTVTSTNTAPVAVIAPANPSGPAPFTANLNANSSSDPNGHALTFAWDLDNDGAFDDGTGATASRSYPVGTHTVRLQATDSIGATNVATTTVTSTNTAPVAVIAQANPSGPAPFTASLNANSSSDPNGHALTFAWDLDNDGAFDDGTGATASRSYPVGTHTVRLRATDSIGATNVAQTTVTSTNQPPVAVISPANPSGPAPLLVNFDANGSSDPNAHALTFAWDLDNDGAFDDATGATASQTYPVGDHVVRLRATDSIGATNVAQVTVASGNTAPVLGVVTPVDGAHWSVGETVAFSASATDDQDGTLPASAFTWTLEKVECATGCSPVVVETFDDVTSGSFVAPDLDLPAHLLLTVTVVDSRGTPATETVRLDPRTVDLSFATSPAGMDVDLARMTSTPTTRTVIVGSKVTVSAPERQRQGPRLYEFESWSDGGPRTHVVTAPTGARLYVASYAPVRRRVTFLTRPGGLDVKVDGKARADRWARLFDVGESVKVAAPKRQWRDGVLYEFVRWSDDGARVHSIVVPDVRMRLRAVYRRVQV